MLYICLTLYDILFFIFLMVFIIILLSYGQRRGTLLDILFDSIPFLWDLILGLWIFLKFLCMDDTFGNITRFAFFSSKPFSSSFIFLTYYVVQEPPLLCWKLLFLVEHFVPWNECFYIFFIPNNIFSRSFGRWLLSVK